MTEPARLLRIHVCESDKAGDRPLHEAIVMKCREEGIAGATVLRGVEGYGETAEIHRGHLISADRPVVVMIVDSEDNIDRILPTLEEMVDTGMIAMSDVQIRRIHHSS